MIDPLAADMDIIIQFAKENLVPGLLHGWPHIQRVLKYAEKINYELNGNWRIIQIAIFLHDIGHQTNKKDHQLQSIKMAEPFLQNLGMYQQEINHIIECISSHSRQYSTKKPESAEAKVLYDADGMDLFGPIGLMRALLSVYASQNDFSTILKKLEWRITQADNFFSETARKYVEANVIIIQSFLNQLKTQLHSFSE